MLILKNLVNPVKHELGLMRVTTLFILAALLLSTSGPQRITKGQKELAT